MNYGKFTFEDFIQDEFFKKWVRKPDRYTDDFWKSYLQHYPEKSDDVKRAKYFILSLQFPMEGYRAPGTNEMETVYENVLQSAGTSRMLSPKKSYLKIYYMAAASIAIIFLFAASWYWVGAPEKSEQKAKTEWVEKLAPAGQKLTVKLKDGSIVKLNSGSKLRYPSEFAADSREVLLEGEAFFQVSKDIYKPFIVKSGGLLTRVLGTSFIVKGYDNEPDVQVAVLTGKVLVSKEDQNNQVEESDRLYLEPMEGITYTKLKNELRKEKVNYNNVFAWKDNVLYFENSSFQEITQTLGRWYGKEFIVKTNVPNEKDFSGVYDNQSLELVLEGVSFAFGVNYEIAGDQVVIY